MQKEADFLSSVKGVKWKKAQKGTIRFFSLETQNSEKHHGIFCTLVCLLRYMDLNALHINFYLWNENLYSYHKKLIVTVLFRYLIGTENGKIKDNEKILSDCTEFVF